MYVEADLFKERNPEYRNLVTALEEWSLIEEERCSLYTNGIEHSRTKPMYWGLLAPVEKSDGSQGDQIFSGAYPEGYYMELQSCVQDSIMYHKWGLSLSNMFEPQSGDDGFIDSTFFAVVHVSFDGEYEDVRFHNHGKTAAEALLLAYVDAIKGIKSGEYSKDNIPNTSLADVDDDYKLGW